VAFQAVEVGTAGGVEWIALGDGHLAMENIYALDAELGGAVHDGFDGDFCRLEVPVGIRGDAEFHAFAGRGSRSGSGFGGERGGAQCEGGAGGKGGG